MDEEIVNWFPEDLNEAVSDHNATLMVLMLVGMVPLRGIGLAISMHYRGVHPSCTIADLKADLLFRTEDVLAMLSVGEIKALQAGRIEAGTRMQKLATSALGRIIVD